MNEQCEHTVAKSPVRHSLAATFAKGLFGILIGAMILLASLYAVDLFSDNSSDDNSKASVSADFSAVNAICELATVEGYYHNVATLEKAPEGLFKYGLFQYGYKKLWLEYTGIVVAGIDCSKVKIDPPDKNGKVTVHIPDAEILEVTADNESVKIVTTKTGVLTNISVEDETEAFASAQASMENSVLEDNSILTQAKSRAKKLLEEYIINVGKSIGQNYVVDFVEVEEVASP